MPYSTEYTTENLTTSLAVYLANNFTQAGWAIYWQATDVLSGTATMGEVTLVPEFPNDPNVLTLDSGTRTADKVFVPAFSVRIEEPVEMARAGLGEDLFETRTMGVIEGYAKNEAQHLAFATMLRNWFREGYNLPVYNYTADPANPPVIDGAVVFENRVIDRVKFVDLPRPVKYYINLEVDIVYFD